MAIGNTLDRWHAWARRNRWMGLFSIFCRVALAAGFIPSGLVKIMGERFTDLANEHPMGAYLEALFHTGFYYPMIGVMQVTAAVLLLIPRTATLGALIYFPIILNIMVLSIAVRFDGSLFTSPLMVIANLFLLCWDYHKLKHLFPWNHNKAKETLPTKEEQHWKFPFAFAGVVLAVFFAVVIGFSGVFDLYPRNSQADCNVQCPGEDNPEACLDFCACLHVEGNSLDSCLVRYDTYKPRHQQENP